MDLPKTDFFKTYPYVVRVYQTKGERGWQHSDVGRRVEKKDGTVVLRLKNMRKDLPFPDYRYVAPGPGGKQYIDYYSTAEGEFAPIEVDLTGDGAKKVPVEKDVLLWYVTDFARRQRKYAEDKALWEKLFPILMMGMVVIGYAMTIIMNSQTAIQIAAIQERLVVDQQVLWEKVGTILDKADGVINDKTIIAQNGGTAPARPPI